MHALGHVGNRSIGLTVGREEQLDARLMLPGGPNGADDRQWIKPVPDAAEPGQHEIVRPDAWANAFEDRPSLDGRGIGNAKRNKVDEVPQLWMFSLGLKR